MASGSLSLGSTIATGGGGGSGTVTSVAISAPSIFTVSGSPVTTTGTLTLSLATQTANTVFAGPTSGGAAAPTFRLLVGADLPALLSAHIFVGNASNVATDVAVSGDLTLANTGAFTIANNAVTNAKLAQMPTLTIKGNNTGGTADALDLTIAQVNAILGGTTVIGAIDTAAVANGLSISGNTLSTQSASVTVPGMVNNTTQSFSGAKTFTSSLTAPSLVLSGTAGAGYVTFPTQSSPPSAPASGFREFADSTGRFSWISASDGFIRTLDGTLTANRVYTLPDATTTIVGTDTTQTLTNKTIAAGSNTITGLTNTNLSGSAGITNANLAAMAAGTFKGNNTTGSATPTDLTIAQALSALGVMSMFGDGSDGALSISSGTTTLTRDTYYTNVTISGTASIATAGYRLFISGTLDILAAPASAITRAGSVGGSSTAGPGGAVGTAQTAATLGNGGTGTSGAAAGTGAGSQAGAPTSHSPSNGGSGGLGAAGGAGSGGAGGGSRAGGTATIPTTIRFPTIQLLRGATLILGGDGGAGGGSGGGDGSVATGGGAGGCGGGVLGIWANTINRDGATASGAITASGGLAGNSATAAGNRGSGGGGGGGGGGWAYIVYKFLLGSAATTAVWADGGGGGNAGNGAGTGIGGDGGSSGAGGRINIMSVDSVTSVEVLGSASVAGTAGSGTTGGTGAAVNTTRSNL